MHRAVLRASRRYTSHAHATQPSELLARVQGAANRSCTMGPWAAARILGALVTPPSQPYATSALRSSPIRQLLLLLLLLLFLPLLSTTLPMGSFCGKQSKDDNFQGTGRTLDSAPPQPTRASVPARTANQPKATSPGRTLGRVQDSSSAGDPRAATAAAAEVRSRMRKRLLPVQLMTTTVWM